MVVLHGKGYLLSISFLKTKKLHKDAFGKKIKFVCTDLVSLKLTLDCENLAKIN